MDKLQIHQGVAVPLIRENIDTDAIIPSREMKRVSKLGLGEGLFAGWRYTLPGGREPNPEFALNKPEYANCSIILAGANFGCGSSREHAVWALKEFGIRIIIAPGFGSIFYNNCIRNGVLPLVLAERDINALANSTCQDPQQNQLTVDLLQKVVVDTGGLRYSFDIEDAQRRMLLEGLDAIALTLKLADKIADFQQARQGSHPWLFLS